MRSNFKGFPKSFCLLKNKNVRQTKRNMCKTMQTNKNPSLPFRTTLWQVMMHTTLFGWLKQLLNHLLGSLAGNNPSSAFVPSVGTNNFAFGTQFQPSGRRKGKGGFYSSVPDFHDTPPAIPLSFKDISWYEKQLLHHFHAFLYHFQGITLYPSILPQSDPYWFYIPYWHPRFYRLIFFQWLLFFAEPALILKLNCPGAHSRICKPSSMYFSATGHSHAPHRATKVRRLDYWLRLSDCLVCRPGIPCIFFRCDDGIV